MNSFLKLILMISFMSIVVPVYGEDVFERHCIPCHKKMNISLQKTFMKALLVYGGKENMKAGLAYYFKNPHVNTSVMDEDFIRKNGIKEPMKIASKLLDEALDIYWNRYTVIGKLR
jgi:hypothetical protein